MGLKLKPGEPSLNPETGSRGPSSLDPADRRSEHARSRLRQDRAAFVEGGAAGEDGVGIAVHMRASPPLTTGGKPS